MNIHRKYGTVKNLITKPSSNEAVPCQAPKEQKFYAVQDINDTVFFFINRMHCVTTTSMVVSVWQPSFDKQVQDALSPPTEWCREHFLVFADSRECTYDKHEVFLWISFNIYSTIEAENPTRAVFESMLFQEELKATWEHLSISWSWPRDRSIMCL